MENTTKAIIGVLALTFIVVLTTNLVSAEFWACFDQGERIEFCNNYKPAETCTLSNGCQRCMSVYNEATDCYVHGSWPKCNQLPQGCSVFGNGSNIDEEPPVFELSSPLNDSLFTERSALVEFSLDEIADVYYTDVIDGRGRWIRVCSNCNPGNPSYSRERSFSEGMNLLEFRAVDGVGNEAFETVQFFIDSKKPKIKKAEPKKGFANGDFFVEFQEENPELLTIYYGNNNENIGIDTCIPSGTSNDKMKCNTHIDLSSYDGQVIGYWWTIEDIAGNTHSYKKQNISVDMTAPVVTNPDSFFHYENGTKYVYFHLDITEQNFDEVVYSYLDDRGRIKEKRICSRLDEGMCEKKLSFREGIYNLTVSVWDEAGNSIALPADFVVDY